MSLLQADLRLAGRLDMRFFTLLQALQQTGSLQRAARAAGYSYKGAWLLLDQATNLAQTPLVQAQQGGRGGGGSQLTPAALALLLAWQQLQQRQAEFLREQQSWLLAQFTDHPELAALLRRRAMKTTARNQFVGRIAALTQGPSTVQVRLELPGGLPLRAAINAEAAAALDLQIGQEALAMVKASEVVLVQDFAGYKLSASNQLAGTISRLEKGATGALVGLTLPGGMQLTASVTHDAVEALDLRVGQPATACFKAYAVMVAVAG